MPNTLLKKSDVMKLIPLEEIEKIFAYVEKTYADNHGIVKQMKRDINNIETIDPVEIIEEMIGEYQEKKDNVSKGNPLWDDLDYYQSVLKNIKSRLSLNKK